MSKVQLGIPKGTRDFGPEVMARRNYIFNTIRQTFHKFGFQQIETPAMEDREVLTGKYGDEGDKLIFKILNSGDFLSKKNIEDVVWNEVKVRDNPSTEMNSKKLIPLISEKALRYDLTVPLARYVVMHQNEISFPFKRYQIQPVWRADRPQKGRYREFYQCDVDIIGTDSLLNELELIQIFDEVLSNLKLDDFTININNRKVLSGLAEVLNARDKFMTITIAIDKLDKIGLEKVKAELQENGLNDDQVSQIGDYLQIKGSIEEKLESLKQLLAASETGLKGIEELDTLYNYLKQSGNNLSNIDFAPTLARGLDYYTGAIFEVQVNNVKIGSIAAGGRYDDLTGIFGLPGVSGVGISFGADRVYDCLEALNLFPGSVTTTTQLLFTNFDAAAETYCLPLLQKVRAAGISAEIYPDHAKLKKQFKYADNKKIPYVAVAGSEEMQTGKLSLKNMQSGEQEKLSAEEVIKKLL